jgi:hypothetical protein
MSNIRHIYVWHPSTFVARNSVNIAIHRHPSQFHPTFVSFHRHLSQFLQRHYPSLSITVLSTSSFVTVLSTLPFITIYRSSINIAVPSTSQFCQRCNSINVTILSMSPFVAIHHNSIWHLSTSITVHHNFVNIVICCCPSLFRPTSINFHLTSINVHPFGFIHPALFVHQRWRAPKFLIRPKRGLTYSNNGIVRNSRHAPSSQH